MGQFTLCRRRWCPFSLLAATALLASVTSAEAQTVVNGDLEASPPGTGWSFADFASVQLGGNPGNCIRLESNGIATSDPTAAQSIAGFVPGNSYTVSWDYRLEISYSGAANGPSFGVFLDTQTLGTALFLDTYLVGTYKRSSATFTATSNTHTIIFAGELDGRSNGGGTTDVSYAVDNISLVGASAVPEPGAFGLALAGFSVWIGLRRARVRRR